ncbi:N-acyl homoserine lactonase family protein [Solimonas soli]|uniref:N-acyl homoserine lactonase family protein n=1 Tax=Solimonas soli TaxID=413479 RepID=UPI0004808763|nr:N-acyl homoserine lactonase family protein [Solimonas soli]
MLARLFPRALAVVLFTMAAAAVSAAPAAAPSLRLYTLDCGHLSLPDMGMFDDGGSSDGRPGEMAVPCFLIRHPQGDLLWDTGLGDRLAAHPGGVVNAFGIRESVETPLLAQLAALGVKPDKVRYVAFSHLHADHTGNANLFVKSTWLLAKAELDAGLATPAPIGVDPALFSAYRQARVETFDLDHDVFGDGSVRILRAPGHTAGHSVLLLKLAKGGAVILSGDLYHSRANYEQSRVPPINFSRAETLASFDRVAHLLQNLRARLIIQHDPGDFAALPKPPAYLD